MSLFTGAALLGTALAAAGGSVAAAKLNSGAAQNAADKQAAAAQEALDFTKGQKAKQEAAYAPFQQISQNALANPVAARGSIGGPLSAMGSQQPPSSMSAQSGPMMPQAPTPQMPQGQGNGAGMVLLQAPDGSQKQVPQNQAQFFISRGAKQIG